MREFDPYAWEFHEDPYPTYARLRDVFFLIHTPAAGFYTLSRHVALIDAFRDSARFSSARRACQLPAAMNCPVLKITS